METKNQEEVVLEKLKFLNFPSYFIVPPHGHGGGGLILLWTNDVSISIETCTENFIDTSIKLRRKTFYLTFVYGAPEVSDRKEVWNSISSCLSTRHLPSLLTGDFNDLLSNDEKKGGVKRPESSFNNFRSFVASNDLWDVKHTGNLFSWRGQRGDHLVHCRLDRSLVTSSWDDLFPFTHCEYLELESSDHRPLLTFIGRKKKKKKRIFRFDRRLQDKKEIMEIIRKVWHDDTSPTVELKLKDVKLAVCKWSKEEFFRSQEELTSLRKRLDEALSSSLPTETLTRDLNKKLQQLYMEDEKFWRQRSRVSWLQEGDKNTAFFHASTKVRAHLNKFTVIENELGEACYEEEDIAKVISSYYTKLFTSSGYEGADVIQEAITPCISEEWNNDLTKIPTRDEIMQAISDTHSDKAPGPDGFPAGFFKSQWEVVGPDMVEEIQSFFREAHLPPSLNHTYVRLIPKITAPQKVIDYRPIALCNVHYKFIAKILANRLRPLLRHIISENQTAFVGGRAITDNVLLTHEVLHSLKRSKAKKFCYMAVKTDMSKAYDRLEWGFIKGVLERFGFHDKWITWVLLCVSSVSYSYLVNDSLSHCVTPSRGIRQGDPLSPYLFILCGEVLSGLCRKAENNGTLPGIKIGRGAPRLNHLLFADDTMFFCRANASSASTLLDILKNYEKASGQMINTSKSSIVFSAKAPLVLREDCKRILGIDSEGGCGKYLGLPEHFGRKKKDIFASILSRISQRMEGWSSKCLSTAGKLVLLKAVLTAIPNYTMSCFRLPKSLCKKIASLLTRFFWDTNTKKRKMVWISWKRMARPKTLGGLGFRDVIAFNDALLAKISWRIWTNPTSLLARTLTGKYCVESSFQDCTPSTTCSHGWRGILAGRDVIKKKLIHSIGNGQDTLIWTDPWIEDIQEHKPYGPCTLQMSESRVRDLLTPDGRTWNKDKVCRIFPHLEREILSIKLSTEGAMDRLHWLGTRDGIYSTKSGYFSLVEDEPLDTDVSLNVELNWCKSLWKIVCAPKIHIFLWRLLSKALPVGAILHARGISESDRCHRCGEVETLRHVFFECPFAKEVWNLMQWKTDLVFTHVPLEEAIMSSLNLITLPPIGVGNGPLTPWILWSLWKSRNFLIFQQRTFSQVETLAKAIGDAREWQEAQLSKTTVSSGARKNLIPPAVTADTVITHTDASWSETHKLAGLGIHFKDPHTGRSFTHAICEEYVKSPLLGEALAIKEALRQAIDLGHLELQILSDSKTCIDAINAHSGPRELYSILSDILSLSKRFSAISFSYISRNENCIADVFAKNSLRDFIVERDLV